MIGTKTNISLAKVNVRIFDPEYAVLHHPTACLRTMCVLIEDIVCRNFCIFGESARQFPG